MRRLCLEKAWCGILLLFFVGGRRLKTSKMSLTYPEVRKLCSKYKKIYPNGPPCNATRARIESWLNQHNLLKADDRGVVEDQEMADVSNLTYKELQTICSVNKINYADAPSCKAKRAVLEAWIVKHNLAVSAAKQAVKRPVPEAQKELKEKEKKSVKRPVPETQKERKENGKKRADPAEKGNILKVGPNSYQLPSEPFLLPHTAYSDTYLFSKKLPFAKKASYVVLKKALGEGGMGTVSIAKRKKDHKEFALKTGLFKCNGIEYSKETLSFIPRSDSVVEVAALIMLKHPNILEINDVLQSRGVKSMSMGILLPKAQGSLSILPGIIKANVGVKEISYQIICGIGYLHSMHLVHHDIKLGNILFNYDTESKKIQILIADMGTVRSHVCETKNFKLTWTPAYGAPEVHLKSNKRNQSLDVWSTAVSIYRIALGKFPWVFDNKKDKKDILPGYARNLGGFKSTDWKEGYDVGLQNNYFAGSLMKKTSTARYRKERRDEITKKFIDIGVEGLFDLLLDMMAWNPAKRPSLATILTSKYWDSVRDPSLEYKMLTCDESREMRSRHPTELVSFGKRKEVLEKQMEIFSRSGVSYLASKRTQYASAQLFDELLLVMDTRKKIQLDTPSLDQYAVICADLTLMQETVTHCILREHIKLAVPDHPSTQGLYETRRLEVLELLNYDLIFTTPHDYMSSKAPENSFVDAILLTFILSGDFYTKHTPKELYERAMDVVNSKRVSKDMKGVIEALKTGITYFRRSSHVNVGDTVTSEIESYINKFDK